jgi:hypothetical protein
MQALLSNGHRILRNCSIIGVRAYGLLIAIPRPPWMGWDGMGEPVSLSLFVLFV